MEEADQPRKWGRTKLRDLKSMTDIESLILTKSPVRGSRPSCRAVRWMLTASHIHGSHLQCMRGWPDSHPARPDLAKKQKRVNAAGTNGERNQPAAEFSGGMSFRMGERAQVALMGGRGGIVPELFGSWKSPTPPNNTNCHELRQSQPLSRNAVRV